MDNGCLVQHRHVEHRRPQKISVYWRATFWKGSRHPAPLASPPRLPNLSSLISLGRGGRLRHPPDPSYTRSFPLNGFRPITPQLHRTAAVRRLVIYDRDYEIVWQRVLAEAEDGENPLTVNSVTCVVRIYRCSHISVPLVDML